MQLEGSTRQFPLTELIALIGESSATGMLEIEAPGKIGRIFCRAGQIYHAEAGNETAFDALRQLIQADDASFRFVLGARHCDETLRADTLSLIGHVRRQEWLYRRMCHYIPTLESIPALCASNGNAEVRLSATLWPALALIDGRRSVAAIAAELGHEPFEVGMLLGQLVARGLVTIKPQSITQSDAEERASDAALGAPSGGELTVSTLGDPSGGFFERLLTSRTEEQPTPKPVRRRIRLPHLIFS